MGADEPQDMPTPPTPPETRQATTKTDAAAVVGGAIAAIRPIVSMWRDGLTVIALDSELKNYAPDYLTLDQAAASAEGLQIQEAAQQTVPSVDAVTGLMPVLILGGDTIIGGAQNRIINITILLKAAAKTAISVTCLEHGRWNQGGRFTASRQVDHALRSMVAEQVTLRAARPRMPGDVDDISFAADQGALWAEIGQRHARAAVNSPTQALHDVYEREEASVDDFVRAFAMPPGSRGVAIGLFNRLVGLDLFDSTETLERQWPRLVASAASALLDQRRAIDAGVMPKPAHGRLDSGALDRMLARAATALTNAAISPSVGLGRDVRFAAPKVVGTALVHKRRAIHVALFRPA